MTIIKGEVQRLCRLSKRIGAALKQEGQICHCQQVFHHLSRVYLEIEILYTCQMSSDADSKEYIRTGIFPIGKQGQDFEGSKVVSARYYSN